MQGRRLTPEQLKKMEEGRIAAQKQQEAERKEQENKEKEREKQIEQALIDKERLEQLISVADALYNEMALLNKKAPEMTISDLTLNRVNKVISAIKDFMKNTKDDFIEEIVEFVPAGDNPQYRDVVLVLSQIRAGLSRYNQSHAREWRSYGILD